MSTEPEHATPQSDAAELIYEISSHALLLRVLVSVGEHDIPDRLARGAQTAAELAAEAQLDAPTLYRLLRFLASYGFFREDESGRFHLTPRADALRAEADGSQRDRLRRPWQDLLWRSYERLPDMLRTGKPAFDQAHGRPFFEYLAAQPEVNAIFDRNMARVSAIENSIIAAHYPFGRHHCVVDVGGGQGGLLAAILDQHPGVRGVLFDQPQVVAAPDGLADSRYAGHWRAVPGDFFRSLPPDGDVYVMKRIIHDWDDRRALAILSVCREALRGQPRLLIVDAVMKPGNAPDPNKYMDINIMALTSGRERTEPEFRRLCERSGMRVLQVTPLPAPATLSIVEVGLA